MELEDLKRSWERFTVRLEREEVVRRQEMQRLLTGKVRSLLHYTQHMALLNVLAVPVCVAIGRYRGVPDGVIAVAVAGFLALYLPSLWGLGLLMRAARCEDNIVELERRMTRYDRFAWGCLVYQLTGVVLGIGVLVVLWSGYYTAQGMWWTVAALLAAAAVICFVAIRYERERLREVRQRIRALREFEAES